MRISSLALSVLASAIAACSSSTEGTNPAAPAGAAPVAPSDQPPIATTTSALQTVACRYIVPKSAEGKTFHCVDLSVPEDRRDPNSKKITLHAAVIHGKANGIPTIELIGGPGAGGDDMVGALAAGASDLVLAYGKILEQGDLVVLDQRGIGRSIPRLSCDPPTGLETSQAAAAATCAKALQAKGIKVEAYDTAENADDVHDLKVALGVPKVDLHGISYGTRLGLEILKRHPDDVRAAIIDGVMPPDVPIFGGFQVAIDGVITKVFQACKADAKCNATYPDLEGSIAALQTKLNATPFTATDPDYGDEYPYDFTAFVDDLIQQGYSEGTHAKIPYRIKRLLTETQDEFTKDAQAAANHGPPMSDADYANPLLNELYDAYDRATDEDYAAMDEAHGMYLSVTCNDYGQYETVDASLAATKNIRTVFQAPDEVENEFSECKSWPTRASEPDVRKPATFGGPTLVIGGGLDAATPQAWAERAASSLTHSQLVVVPTGGHGLMDSCGATLKGSFLADPDKALDASCATSRTLEFYYAEQTARSLFRDVSVKHLPAVSQQDRIANRILGGAYPASATVQKHIALVAQHRTHR